MSGAQELPPLPPGATAKKDEGLMEETDQQRAQQAHNNPAVFNNFAKTLMFAAKGGNPAIPPRYPGYQPPPYGAVNPAAFQTALGQSMGRGVGARGMPMMGRPTPDNLQEVYAQMMGMNMGRPHVQMGGPGGRGTPKVGASPWPTSLAGYAPFPPPDYAHLARNFDSAQVYNQQAALHSMYSGLSAPPPEGGIVAAVRGKAIAAEKPRPVYQGSGLNMSLGSASTSVISLGETSKSTNEKLDEANEEEGGCTQS